MKKRNFTKMIRLLMLTGVLVISLGVIHFLTTRSDPVSGTKEGSMDLANAFETRPAEIPQVDAAAPAVFETASFGLG